MNKKLKLFGLTLWYALLIAFVVTIFLTVCAIFIALIGQYAGPISFLVLAIIIFMGAYEIAKHKIK